MIVLMGEDTATDQESQLDQRGGRGDASIVLER